MEDYVNIFTVLGIEMTVGLMLSIALCIAFGFVLKTYKYFPDKYIPIALVCVGITVNCLTNESFSPINVFAGVLVGILAVGGHQLIKQLNKPSETTTKQVKTPTKHSI